MLSLFHDQNCFAIPPTALRSRRLLLTTLYDLPLQVIYLMLYDLRLQNL